MAQIFRISLLLLLISMALSPSHVCQNETTWYLPGAAETAGRNGTWFSSTLTLSNPGSLQVPVQIGFIPYPGKTVPTGQSRTLAPGQTMRQERVLRTLFGLTSDAGTLTFSSGVPLYSALTTENVASPIGTYGLALQPVDASSLLTVGFTGHSIWVTQNAAFRTNVALFLPDQGSSVTLEVYDEQNVLRGSASVSAAAPMSWQAAISDLIGPADLNLGKVEMHVVQGRAFGYTAVVDNVTGDGIAVPTLRLESDFTDWLLNGVARSPGVAGTYWSSDVRLFNPQDTALLVSIDSLGFPGGSIRIVRSLPAHSIIEITDILGPNGLGYEEGVAGALRFQADSPFLVAARTTNLDPTGQRTGSFSAYVRAVPYARSMVGSPAAGIFAGLDQSSGFRTNLAFLAGADGVAGGLSLRDPSGSVLSTISLALSPFQWQQKNLANWFPSVVVPPSSRVDVQLTQGALDGYASRIDNGTGDAVVLPISSGITGVITESPPMIGGCSVFPPDNPWNRDISNDPVDPNSANYLASMNASFKHLHPDFGSNPTYGIPYTLVPGTQPKVPMSFDYADESDPGPYPFPSEAPIEGGSGSTGDRHVLVVDTGHCLLYETWDSHYIGPGWHCGSGALFDLSSNRLRPDGWTSADAAGLPILPGLVRYDEAAIQGEIHHALRFTVQQTQRAYVHPATHYASSDTNPNLPPMGLRVRLKAGFDISGFDGTSRAVLVALKKYGMMVADNGSDWYITGATDSRWDDANLEDLKTVPASAFEVVQLGSIHH
ncbi:MAG TPA: hypothetical protein VMW38_22625 [Terriglobia bacterium]|nr:hypothetical protein [Terriglobia bacterium]